MHKCNQCGHNFEGKFCSECGAPYSTAYVKEESYQSFNSEFEKEKKQCKVLLMLLNNADFKYLKEQALKILNLNPDNSLAQMIYNCDFRNTIYRGLYFVELNENPLEEYLKEQCGKIDVETCMTFLYTLVNKEKNDGRIGDIMRYLVVNIFRLGLSEQDLFTTLGIMAKTIGDEAKLKEMVYESNRYDSSSFEGFDRQVELNHMVENAYASRRQMANAFKSMIECSQLLENQKLAIYKVLGKMTSQPVDFEDENNKTSIKKSAKTNSNAIGGGATLIVSGAMITFLGVYIFWPLLIMGGAMIIGGIVCLSKSKKK